LKKVEKDYEELLKLFNKNKVKYCIVGAFALAFHAIPRYTKDMDIFIEASEKNAKGILKALNEFGFGVLNLSMSDFSAKGRTIQLGYEPVRIDILTLIDGCTFEDVWKNKKTGRYGKEKIFFIGLDDMIKNKKASKRKQDKADLEILSAVKKLTKIRRRLQ
jgi:hypothetical protein